MFQSCHGTEHCRTKGVLKQLRSLCAPPVCWGHELIDVRNSRCERAHVQQVSRVPYPPGGVAAFYGYRLLTLFPNTPVTLRQSEHSEATTWIYLDGETLCEAKARELRRPDGTYRTRLPRGRCDSHRPQCLAPTRQASCAVINCSGSDRF